MAIIWSRELDEALKNFVLPGEKLTHTAVARARIFTTTGAFLTLAFALLARQNLNFSKRQAYFLVGLTTQRLLWVRLNSATDHGLDDFEERPLEALAEHEIKLQQGTTELGRGLNGVTLQIQGPSVDVKLCFVHDDVDRNLERAQNMARVLTSGDALRALADSASQPAQRS
jgi:hypothetical protein